MTKEKKGKMSRKKENAMLALLEKRIVAKAAKAVKVGEASKIFEDLKSKLRKKYGDFPEEDVQCIWCRKFGRAG